MDDRHDFVATGPETVEAHFDFEIFRAQLLDHASRALYDDANGLWLETCAHGVGPGNDLDFRELLRELFFLFVINSKYEYKK